MRRFLLLPLVLLGLATLGLASADAFTTIHQADASGRGVIVKITPTSVSIRRNRRHGLTCSLGSASPSLQLFAFGDRVKIACASGVLVAIADLPSHTKHGPNSEPQSSPTTTASDDGNLTYAVGPITARSDNAISVQTMTCSVGSGSPSTSGFTVGTLVRMYCKNGQLIGLKRTDDGAPSTTTTTTTTTTTPPAYAGVTGTIVTLNGSTIGVNRTSGDGPLSLTCSLGSGSPSTSGFAAGNPVRMYCKDGVLFAINHLDGTPPTTSTTTTTTTTTAATPPQNISGISGSITTLTGTSIAVTGGDDGKTVLSCPIGNTSPSTSGFSMGDSVRMYCVNGVLYQLKHNDPPPATTTTSTTTTTLPQNVTSSTGTLTALGSSSITVGDLTCTVTNTSPSTSGFAVGNNVQMYCVNGGLYALTHK
jgi:hypothetical protein